MKTYHLDSLTLGPSFSTHTQESFLNYVESLKEEKAIDKVPKLPRVKKLIVQHSVVDSVCTRCRRKPRNPSAVCSPKKEKKIILTTESIAVDVPSA